MIDMGMRQKNVIHIRSRNRNFLILIKILALLLRDNACCLLPHVLLPKKTVS